MTKALFVFFRSTVWFFYRNSWRLSMDGCLIQQLLHKHFYQMVSQEFRRVLRILTPSEAACCSWENRNTAVGGERNLPTPSNANFSYIDTWVVLSPYVNSLLTRGQILFLGLVKLLLASIGYGTIIGYRSQ